MSFLTPLLLGNLERGKPWHPRGGLLEYKNQKVVGFTDKDAFLSK